jgi:hypothetical protein
LIVIRKKNERRTIIIKTKYGIMSVCVFIYHSHMDELLNVESRVDCSS